MSTTEITYKAPIHIVEEFDNAYSFFSVLEHKIEGLCLKILISHQRHTDSDPEVEGRWIEKKSRLYLVGGKLERPIMDYSTGCVQAPPIRKTWVEMDLSTLGSDKSIKVCVHLMESRQYIGSPGGDPFVITTPEADGVIATIQI